MMIRRAWYHGRCRIMWAVCAAALFVPYEIWMVRR